MDISEANLCHMIYSRCPEAIGHTLEPLNTARFSEAEAEFLIPISCIICLREKSVPRGCYAICVPG